MERMLTGFGLLNTFIARDQRNEVTKVRAQLSELATVVDGFYDLLGPRHWVFHDQLSVEMVKDLLGLPADEAEDAFIQHYRDRETLGRYIRGLRRFEAFRVRMPLIEHALAHYEAERWDAVALSLIPVMDGFVNDVDPAARRGLHTREAGEMAAWDSVAGHHLGLSHAHKTFTKSFRKTVTEEVFELYRHGIVHGMVVNFDNPVVATKAWNRLFSVADWATAREKANQEPEPEPSLLELLRDTAVRKRALDEDKEAMEAFQAATVGPVDEGFECDPLHAMSSQYLSAWQARNYGRMAGLIVTHMREPTDGQTAGKARESCELFPLDSWCVTQIDHVAAAVSEVDVTLTIDGEECLGRLRWIREGADGFTASPNRDGAWRLALWGPHSILNRREA